MNQMPSKTRKTARRRWVWLAVVALLVLVIGVVALRLSDVVRLAAIAQLRLATGRPVAIDALSFDPFTGQLAIRGFRLSDRDGSLLGEIEQLDVRIHLRSLLRGHVWIREIAVVNSTVHVVRRGNGDFNFADLIPRGEKTGSSSYDVTVDRFTLRGGTVALEDRALTPTRTWHSRDIVIDARDVSTRGRTGVAEASSTVEGAPVSVRIDELQLAPVHLRGRITTKGMDLAIARLYVPESAPVTLGGGRVDGTVSLVHDARDGTRVDMDVHATDFVGVRRYQSEPVLRAPVLTLQIRDLGVSPDGTMTLAHVEVAGRGTVADTAVSPPARFDLARVRLSADDLTWPVTRPARLAMTASLATGGDLTVSGTARTGPSAADLDIRLTGLRLEPWARYVPGPTKATGVAEAAFTVHADLEGRVAARARGQAAVQRAILTHGDRRLMSADRAEVLGVDVEWPSRITIDQVRVRRPTAAVARDASGEIDLRRILAGSEATSIESASELGVAGMSGSQWKGQVRIGEVAIEGGTLSWADAAVTPASRFTVSSLDVTVHDLTWPRPGPLRVQLRAAAPQGGRVEVAGRVGVDPISADVHVVAKGVELAPYGGYVPIPGRVVGRADLDLAVVVPPDVTAAPIVARGRAGLARATVFDGVRSIVVVDRADAVGLDVEWPSRVTVERLTVARPWVLVERDPKGAFPLQALLTPRGAANATNSTDTPVTTDTTAASPMTVSLGRLVVEGGAARVVDHTVAPAYVEEVSRLSLRATGLGTVMVEPGRIDLNARLGPSGTIALRGAVRPSPLFVDVQGNLREVSVKSLNPYVERFTGWRASNGRISTKLGCLVDGDRLTARSEIGLARLEVVRAPTTTDATQQRIGLPLGMIVALMKDSRGDIRLVVPVGGSVSDPRFDLGETIWGAVRAISIKAVTAPVSWIGRLHVGKDRRIQEIAIDPAPFQPGRTALTAAGEAQLGRLAAFMKQRPDTKMVLTPVVSLGDIEELRREEVRKEIARRAAHAGVPPPQAAAQLFAEHFPRQRVPATVEEIVIAVSRNEEPPEAAAERLAKERVTLARDTLKKAGIDTARLEVHKDAEAAEIREGGQVEFTLTDQVRPRRGLLAELLAKLREAFKTAKQRLTNEHPAASPLLSPK